MAHVPRVLTSDLAMSAFSMRGSVPKHMNLAPIIIRQSLHLSLVRWS